MVAVVAEAETAMITVAAGSAAGVAVSAVAEVAGMAAQQENWRRRQPSPTRLNHFSLQRQLPLFVGTMVVAAAGMVMAVMVVMLVVLVEVLSR